MVLKNFQKSASSRDSRLLLAFCLWCFAIFLAYLAQWLLTPSGKITEGYVLYGIAMSMGVISMVMMSSRVPNDVPYKITKDSRIVVNARTREHRYGIILWLAGLLAAGVSIYTQSQKMYAQAVWSWFIALVALGIGAFIYDHQRTKSRSSVSFHSPEILAIVGILILAAALRFPNLDSIPPNVHGDEAAIGNEARNVLNGSFQNIFGIGWAGHSELGYAIPAFFMKFFGNNLFGLRLASVFLGIFSILFMYLLVKRYFSTRVALLAAFFLSISQWHIHFSRTGFHYMQAAFVSALLFYFLVKGIQENTVLDFLLAGFAVGSSFNVYVGARLILIPFVIYLIYNVLSQRNFLRNRLVGLVIIAFGAAVFLAPLIGVWVHDSSSLFARGGVFIFNRDSLHHVYSSHKINNFNEALSIQTVNTLETFNFHGDSSMQYGQGAPLLDFWTGALFVVGLGYATLRFYRSRYFLFVMWFWSILIVGSILTIDAMFAPRISSMIPVVFIFPAIVIDAGNQTVEVLFGRTGKRLFNILMLVLIVLALHANYVNYFDSYVKYTPADYSTTMSRYIDSINDRYKVYNVGTITSSLHYATAAFLIPDVDGVDVGEQNLTLPLNRVPAKKGVAFIIQYDSPDFEQKRSNLNQIYPKGVSQVINNTLNQNVLYTYLIKNEDLVEAKPYAVLDNESIPRLITD